MIFADFHEILSDFLRFSCEAPQLLEISQYRFNFSVITPDNHSIFDLNLDLMFDLIFDLPLCAFTFNFHIEDQDQDQDPCDFDLVDLDQRLDQDQS